MRRYGVLRSANTDLDKSSIDTAVFDDGEPSKTIQSGKDDADINVIVRRFNVTGQLPPPGRIPQYGDYTGVTDFHTAMNVVRQAEEAFLSLPAVVRLRFGNDPQQFLEFCQDSKNNDELRKMGLANPEDTAMLSPKPEDRPPASKESKNEQRKPAEGAGARRGAVAKSGARGDAE